MSIEDTTGYSLIQVFYGARRAQRSQVLLMNHIDEGIKILDSLEASMVTKEAFAVHPLFQADIDLEVNWHLAKHLDPLVVLLAMEYRQVANDFLSVKIKMEASEEAFGRCYATQEIKLSVIPEVNQMLIADKVQNRKDFERYHRSTHARSNQLDYYFKLWLTKLEVSEEQYSEFVKLIA